jgi:hypothetical protein
MRRGSFLSLEQDDALSLGTSAACGPFEDERAGLPVGFCGGGGMLSKFSFNVVGGVGGSVCLGGLTGMSGIGDMARGA